MLPRQIGLDQDRVSITLKVINRNVALKHDNTTIDGEMTAFYINAGSISSKENGDRILVFNGYGYLLHTVACNMIDVPSWNSICERMEDHEPSQSSIPPCRIYN